MILAPLRLEILLSLDLLRVFYLIKVVFELIMAGGISTNSSYRFLHLRVGFLGMAIEKFVL
jgi:hypothetical protein